MRYLSDSGMNLNPVKTHSLNRLDCLFLNDATYLFFSSIKLNTAFNHRHYFLYW